MEATIDSAALTRYVDRVLMLHAERKTVNGDIAQVYAEAKSAGFVPAIVRQIVRERQMEAVEREVQYALLDAYRHALGMLADTPLGEAAVAAEETTSLHTRRPRPFAEQPIHRGRGRPKKARDDDALALEPAGAA